MHDAVAVPPKLLPPPPPKNPVLYETLAMIPCIVTTLHCIIAADEGLWSKTFCLFNYVTIPRSTTHNQ